VSAGAPTATALERAVTSAPTGRVTAKATVESPCSVRSPCRACGARRYAYRAPQPRVPCSRAAAFGCSTKEGFPVSEMSGFDVAGRRRSPATFPEFHVGRAPGE